MAYVVIHERGNSLTVQITRMFFTQGPHMLGSRRFDHLVSATVVRDASTISAVGKTEGTATTSVASQIVRSAAGYAVAGPLGAIVGGSGGKQNISTNTVTDQKTNIDIYMHLHFKGEAGPISVQVKDENAFQIIQSYVGGTEWTEVQLNEARSLSYAGQASPNIKLAEVANARNFGKERHQVKVIAGSLIMFAFVIYAFYGFTQSNAFFLLKFFYMLFVIVIGGGMVTAIVVSLIHVVMQVMESNHSEAQKTGQQAGEPPSLTSTGTLKARMWWVGGIILLLLLIVFGRWNEDRMAASKEREAKEVAAPKAAEPVYDPVEKWGKQKVDAAQRVMALARQGDRLTDEGISLRVEMGSYIADRNQLFGYVSAIANSDVVLHGKPRNIYFYDPSQKKIAQADPLSGVRLID